MSPTINPDAATETPAMTPTMTDNIFRRLCGDNTSYSSISALTYAMDADDQPRRRDDDTNDDTDDD